MIYFTRLFYFRYRVFEKLMISPALQLEEFFSDTCFYYQAKLGRGRGEDLSYPTSAGRPCRNYPKEQGTIKRQVCHPPLEKSIANS